jgi:hypothetical protein
MWMPASWADQILNAAGCDVVGCRIDDLGFPRRQVQEKLAATEWHDVTAVYPSAVCPSWAM